MSKLRDLEILELHLRGYNQQQIADKVGCTQATVSRRLSKVLAKKVAQMGSKVDEMRQSSYLSLFQIKKFLWDEIFEKKAIGVGQIDRLLKIEERIAKLFGLDSPTKIAPVTPDGDEAWVGMSNYTFLQKILDKGNFELE